MLDVKYLCRGRGDDAEIVACPIQSPKEIGIRVDCLQNPVREDDI